MEALSVLKKTTFNTVYDSQVSKMCIFVCALVMLLKVSKTL